MGFARLYVQKGMCVTDGMLKKTSLGIACLQIDVALIEVW